VTPQRTIEKANENHTDDMSKHMIEHFTILVSPTRRTDLAPCHCHLFLQLKKTSDRTSHLIRCWGQNNSEDALLPNKKRSSVVVDLQTGQTSVELCVLQRNIFILVMHLFPVWKRNKKA